MPSIREWFQNRKKIIQKTAGLEEKKEATNRKMQVAMSILDRRKVDVEVEFDRRKHLNGYHQKLA